MINLRRYATNAAAASRFFKTGPGDYAEHDVFLGVSVPTLRKIAREHADLSLTEIKPLLRSRINEERLLGLIILVNQYQHSSDSDKNKIYAFYLKHLSSVNNWNLVDASAHLIIGAHLFERDRSLLHTLCLSDDLWERRIAIVATWYFIKQNDFKDTLRIAKTLLNDEHHLMHKSVGWMLREVGKKDQDILVAFLDKHATEMPRTMLRYAIERFPEKERKQYLQRRGG